ncbi:hypothetical protein LPJ75_006170 [Coemansia sp. RSA 2598]|nr:hypothetical protein LPJ75_006170 [Coemansia sp. RSA 2598]
MNGNMHFPSMAAHSLYIAPSLSSSSSPSSSSAAQVRNANTGMAQMPVPMHANPSAAAPIRFERAFAPKRGRSSDIPESSDSMDHDGSLDAQQRCIYYRRSIAFISAKRAKAVDTQV